MDDWRRLKQYARDGSEAAFAELIRQHMDLVYSVCQREIGDTMLAEEATQAVFLVLAQKAGSLRQEAALASWLFTTARLTSRSILRRERRRQRREEKAVVEAVIEMEQATPPETPRWEEAEPLLNDALSTLSAAQRSLVILRFWEDRPLADIGLSLGISEDAARMRLSRALNRLRRWLSARNVVLSAAALAAGLPLAVRPAPARCAEALTRLPLSPAASLAPAFPPSQTAQVDVVIVRMLYKPGTPGRNWPGAVMVVTYYVGQKDHLLHKVIVTDPLSPTRWTTRTETNYTEVNPNLPASDFVFTPPPGSHEVTDVSALFPGGKMW